MKILGLIPMVMMSSLSFATQSAMAASCDGLTATIYLQDLPTGRTTCDSARMIAFDLKQMSSISVLSEISGCSRGTDRSRVTDPTVSIRVQLDRKFAESSKIDGFDLGKRLWSLKERHPSIKRVDVCRDVAFQRPIPRK